MLLHDEQAVRVRGHVIASLTDQLHSASRAGTGSAVTRVAEGTTLNTAVAEVRP
jgi:hypothetical protein